MSFLRRLFAREAPRQGAAATTDLSDPAVSIDPFPFYERLRAEGSVVYLASDRSWLVLGYDAAKDVFASPQRFSNAPYAFVDTAMLSVDPPSHGPVRRIVSRAFGGETLRRLEALAGETARTLLRPEMDMVAEFARPLSRIVAADLIGFDSAARASIERVEDSPSTDTFARTCAQLDSVAEQAAMFARLAEDGRDLLGPEEVRSLVRLLWLASTATTERTIAHCVLRLARDPELHRALRDEPALVPAFVEEVVRLHPPENLIRRIAAGETELEGVAIPAGAAVNICLAAANRDPARYEAPAELRLHRSSPGNLSFGSGIHHCVGAPMSRKVVSAAVLALLRHSGQPRLLGEVEWTHAALVLAPRVLRVAM